MMLDVDGNALNGTLPAAWKHLTGLTTLVLKDNTQLYGPVPSEWSSLSLTKRFGVGNTGIVTDPLPPGADDWEVIEGILFP